MGYILELFEGPAVNSLNTMRGNSPWECFVCSFINGIFRMGVKGGGVCAPYGDPTHLNCLQFHSDFQYLTYPAAPPKLACHN